MLFSALAVIVPSLLAFVSAETEGFAVINNLQAPPAKQVFAGEDFVFTWESSVHLDETMTVSVLKGPDSAHLVKTDHAAAGIPNTATGGVQWKPEPEFADPLTVYALKLTLDADQSVFQYSVPFMINSRE